MMEVWIKAWAVLGVIKGNCMIMCEISQMFIDNTCTRNESSPSVESRSESMQPESKGVDEV